VQAFQGKASQAPGLASVFSSYQANVPQLDADIDRVKAKRRACRSPSVFDTLQAYLGSLYVNDFNRFGRTYQVIAQADVQFRMQGRGHRQLKVRNDGRDVPLAASCRSSRVTAPTRSCATTASSPPTSAAGRRAATPPARRRPRSRSSLSETLPTA
jgi:multidrug efflux pump subunit AcrB